MSGIRRPFVLLLFLCLVAAPAALPAAAGGGGHVMTMSEIFWDMGLKVLNVFILGFFLYKILSKPLAAMVAARSDKVRSELETAQRALAESQERLRAFQDKAAGVDAELEALRKQACQDIDKEQKLLLEEARQAAEHIRKHALATIRQEMAKARADLHREAVMLSTRLAEEMVRTGITGDDRNRLVRSYLKEMETAK